MTVARTTTSRRTGLGLFFASMIGAGVIAGGAIAIIEALGFQIPPLIAGLAAVGVGGASLLWSRRWWARVDEAVREAHKTSWYWGGSVGIIIVMALAAALLFDRSGAPLDRYALAAGDSGLILTGIVVTLGLQLTGYGLFWAGWWLSRSR